MKRWLPHKLLSRFLSIAIIPVVALQLGLVWVLIGVYDQRLEHTATVEVCGEEWSGKAWAVPIAVALLGISVILIISTVLLIRNQVKPIRALAQAMERLGKGQRQVKVHQRGASEIRLAIIAFDTMRHRIERLLAQKTTMLAALSHDLNTMLTRLRLEVALMPDGGQTSNMMHDIDDMQHILSQYLTFARDEAEDEEPTPINIDTLIQSVVQHRTNIQVEGHCPGLTTVRGRALRRCLANIIDNGLRYGQKLCLKVRRRNAVLDIWIDDDGPGIPAAERNKVFKPFYRISKDDDDHHIGMGMAIAQDVVQAHGGNIVLGKAPRLGGMRVHITIPCG